MIVGQVTPQPNFGIYISTTKTSYGRREVGRYKDYIVKVHIDERNGTKLIDICNNVGDWLYSKYIYIKDGIRNSVRCENHLLKYPD